MIKTPRRRFAPLETIPASECRQKPTTVGFLECAVCAKTFSAAALVKSPPAFDAALCEFKMAVRLFCDHCGVVYLREYVSTRSGVPLYPIGDVAVERGRDVETFLAKHPEASGVEQA